jgi:hypothetical protein
LIEIHLHIGAADRASIGAVRGKTSAHADVFHGRFVELVPHERVVELVEFESDDPAFAGAVTIATTLAAGGGGTEAPSPARTCRPASVRAIIRPASRRRSAISPHIPSEAPSVPLQARALTAQNGFHVELGVNFR